MPQNRELAKWFIPYVLVTALQYSFAKDSLSYTSPFVTMALRYVVAGSILVVIGRRFLFKKYVILTGFVTAGSTMCWILGLRYVSTGDSAVLSFSMPLFAIPIAALLLREKPRPREIVGTGLGFLGVVVYSLTLLHGSLLIGAILTVVNAIFWAGFTILFRKLREENQYSLVGTQFLIGAIPFVIGSAFYPYANFASSFVIDLIYLAIFGGVIQFSLWSRLLKTERVAKVTTMVFAVPALTVAIQSVQTLALPSATSIIGAFMMFAGVYLSYAGKEENQEEQRKVTNDLEIREKAK